MSMTDRNYLKYVHNGHKLLKCVHAGQKSLKMCHGHNYFKMRPHSTNIA